MSIHQFPNEQKIMESLPEEWISSPFSNFLEIDLDTQDGDTVFLLQYRDGFMGNPSLEAFHGGIVAIFIETSAQLYLHSTGDGGRLQEAETLTVDFLRPSVASEGPLLAVPAIVRQGKNISILSVNVFQKEKMVATGKAIFVANRDNQI